MTLPTFLVQSNILKRSSEGSNGIRNNERIAGDYSEGGKCNVEYDSKLKVCTRCGRRMPILTPLRVVFYTLVIGFVIIWFLTPESSEKNNTAMVGQDQKDVAVCRMAEKELQKSFSHFSSRYHHVGECTVTLQNNGLVKVQAGYTVPGRDLINTYTAIGEIKDNKLVMKQVKVSGVDDEFKPWAVMSE